MIKRLETKANKTNQFQLLKFKPGDVVTAVMPVAAHDRAGHVTALSPHIYLKC
jgi:hypothetical protein